MVEGSCNPPVWSLKYELIGGAGVGAADNRAWPLLIVEPKTSDAVSEGTDSHSQATPLLSSRNSQEAVSWPSITAANTSEISLYVVGASPANRQSSIATDQFDFMFSTDYLPTG